MEITFKWRQVYQKKFWRCNPTAASSFMVANSSLVERTLLPTATLPSLDEQLVEQGRLQAFGVSKVTDAYPHQTKALTGFQLYTLS
jgi:hypothetical protein